MNQNNGQVLKMNKKKSNWKKVKIQFSTHREPNQELNYAVTIQNMIIYHNFLDQIQSFTTSK